MELLFHTFILLIFHRFLSNCIKIKKLFFKVFQKKEELQENYIIINDDALFYLLQNNPFIDHTQQY